MPAIKFDTIDEQYKFGYEAVVGNRRVEVLRAYEGEWLVFQYLDGAMVRHPDGQLYKPLPQAKREAIAFLRAN